MSRNRCQTACNCGLPLVPSVSSDGQLMTEDAYAEISPALRHYKGNGGLGWSRKGETRFRRIECLACGAVYAGWYELDTDWNYTPFDAEKMVWTLFDSSYYVAFNDEPCDEDKPKRPGTINDLFEALVHERDELIHVLSAIRRIPIRGEVKSQ